MGVDGTVILMAVGLWLAAEGLVLALMPGRVEDVLDLLRRMPVETRRNAGLAAATAGTILIWLAARAAA